MSTNLAIIVADFTTSLATALSVGATTATLSSATDDDGVALPSGRYFFSLDNGNASKEHISCDLVGTAISNIVSISRQGALTTGVVRSHRLGATVTITNFAHILYQNNLLNGTDLYDADYPIEYDGSATITGNNQLTTLEKVLTLVNGGTVSIDQTVIAARAGETVASGESLYQSESDGEWYKTDADDPAKSVNVNLGIAQGAGTDGNVIAGGVLIGGIDKTQSYTPGSIYYLSDTAGALATSAGTNSVIVGVGDANNRLVWVNIYDRDAVTPDEKAAMVGSQGTPSASNKYVTDDNVYSDEFDQEQTTQDAAIATGRANATGENNIIAQSFTAGRTKIRGAVLWKEPSTGTNAGDITFSLQADSSGNPSGTDLATVTLSAAVYNGLADDALFEVTFGTEYAGLVQGNLYWIVVSSSTSDNSNHINLGTNSAGGYADGSVKRNNTTDGWVAVADIDLYFKTVNGLQEQISYINIPQTFLSSGTWTKPSVGTSALIQVWGAGGGGGARASDQAGIQSATGGGGGAYNEVKILLSKLPSTVAVTVAVGGPGGDVTTTSTSAEVGSTPPASRFGNYVVASSGNGGSTNASSSTAGGTGGTGSPYISPDGGDGSSGNGGSAIYGGGGGGGGIGDADGDPAGSGGSGGVSITAGNGGAGVGVTTTPYLAIAEDGKSPGGGGGGAYSGKTGSFSKTATGGKGGNGLVIITII